jgi:hypothetical protein
MAEENHLWGAERIRGELFKSAIKVAKRTIQKYLPKDRHPSDQTWPTFLQTHAEAIYVCDFTVVHDICFCPIYPLVVMHLATRQIKHFNLTRSPTDARTAQQMREISAWGEGPRFLICSRMEEILKRLPENPSKIKRGHLDFYMDAAAFFAC